MTMSKLNPFQPPAADQRELQKQDQSDRDKPVLLAIGIIAGVEVIGVPLTLVCALGLGIEFYERPLLMTFIILVSISAVGGLVVSKLLPLAKPAQTDETNASPVPDSRLFDLHNHRFDG